MTFARLSADRELQRLQCNYFPHGVITNKDSFTVPANTNVRTPAIRKPCKWGPDVAAGMHRMALSRFTYDNVGGQLGCQIGKCAAGIRQVPRYRWSFNIGVLSSQSNIAWRWVSAQDVPPLLPPPQLSLFMNLSSTIYIIISIKCFLTSERKGVTHSSHTNSTEKCRCPI